MERKEYYSGNGYWPTDFAYNHPTTPSTGPNPGQVADDLINVKSTRFYVIPIFIMYFQECLLQAINKHWCCVTAAD